MVSGFFAEDLSELSIFNWESFWVCLAQLFMAKLVDAVKLLMMAMS